MGSTWILISQETKTKLIVSHHVGKRNYEDSVKMISDLEAKRDKSTELPLFMSDDFDAYKKALVEVYSTEEQPEYKGRGRYPKPIKVPLPDLRYTQAIKSTQNNEVDALKKKVVFGNEEEILTELEAESHTINTAYIERNNLTIRNGVSRVIRKTINYSKKLKCRVLVSFFSSCGLTSLKHMKH